MKRPARVLRIAAITVVVVLVLLVGAGAVFLASFDPNSLKPRIAEAVKRATGRDLALNGPIGLVLSLSPAVAVRDVAFANPPGYSRPQMATLQSMRLRIALLPLLSRQVQIVSLVLDHPDILLETNAAGQPNWKFAPAVSPNAPAGSQAPATGAAQSKTAVSIESVRIADGRLAYRDGRTGKTTTLGLPAFAATAASPDAPLHVDTQATYNNNPFTLTADTGSLTRLQDSAATTPWPINLTLAAAGANLHVDGSLTHPTDGKGYALAVRGAVPDAAALGRFAPGVAVPALHDVAFAAKVADKGGSLPEISSLTLHAGASDLRAQVPGLTLAKLDVDAPALDQPVKAALAGAMNGAPVSLNAALGALGTLLPNAQSAPFPVDVSAQAAGGSATVKGTVANAQALSGANIAVAAQIPDLAALGPLAQHPLPAIKTIAFHATLTDANGGLRNGAALHGMALTSANGDLSGEATVGLGARKSLTATLKSNRIDADAMQAAMGQQPASNNPPAKPAPAPAQGGTHLLSDKPIPFNQLRAVDADITLNLADVRSGGADYKAIATHAVLRNGDLSVNPLSGDLPGGHLLGSFNADASKPAPPVRLAVHAPGLALKTLLQAAHQPSYASGNLEVNADLSGAGASPHAIASTLNGSLALAMAGGTIDNPLLGSILGKVMNELNALNLVGKGGSSEVRCFAVRMNARNGVGQIDPLVLNSSLLTMTGGGTVNLAPETLAMQLRPQARISGADLVIPIALSGPLRNPAVGVNKAGAAESNVGALAGAVAGKATPLGIVGGLLGADKAAGGSADPCPAALAAARGQPVPQAAAATPAKPAEPGAKQPNLKDPGAVLRNLLR